MEKESLYRLAESGDPEAVSGVAISGDANGNKGIAGSNLLETLRAKRAELKLEVAESSTQFGPSYPKVAQLNNLLKEVDSQIQAEMKKIGGKVKNQYVAAVQRESLLHDALDKQKQEANKLNESAIEYSLLKRDVETNRQLYEGLLEKLKEAGVTAGL